MMMLATSMGQESSSLNEVEAVLLRAIRAIAIGQEDCPAVHSMFLATFGSAAESILQHLFLLVRYVGLASPKPLTLCPPGWPKVSADESGLLELITSIDSLDQRPATSSTPMAREVVTRIAGSLTTMMAGARCTGVARTWV